MMYRKKTILNFFITCLASGVCAAKDSDVSYWELMHKLSTLHSFVTQSNASGNLLKSAEHMVSSSGSLFSMNSAKDLVHEFATGQYNTNVSARCMNDTLTYLNGLFEGQAWALRMADAAGKPPSAILDGNLYWFGGYDECWNVKSVQRTPGKTAGDVFSGRYCKAVLGTPVPKQQFSISGPLSVTYGMCLPSSCESEDAAAFMNTALSLLIPATDPKNRTQVLYSECKEQPSDLELTPFAKGAIAVLVIFGTLILVATIYDVVWQKLAYLQLARSGEYSVNTAEVESHTISNGKILNGEADIRINVGDYRRLPEENDSQKVTEKKQHVSLPIQILLSFSVYTNAAKLLNTSQPGGSLRAVHGIRFISMSWVILGHTFFFALSSGVVGNLLPYLQIMLRRWTFQVLFNATVSVDTFFLLSGALLTYLFMREMEKLGGPRKINWFMFYFHRYWRLTPPYLLIIVIYVPLFRYWSEGPQYPQGEYGVDPNCPDNWWTNALYINNLVNSKKQCMGWSWYLANDMQFFVISPLILLPFFYHWAAGSTAALALILMNFIATGVINTQQKSQASFAEIALDADLTYWKPWCRIGPYAVGMALGYILYKTKCKVKMHWALNLLGWTVAATLALLIIYGIYDDYNGEPLSQPVASLYNATSRTVWSVAVAWVIFACVTGNGGFVNMLLSWKGFIPLSRLTYCAYLVHPVVMYTYYYSMRTPYIASDVQLIYSFFGNLVAAYLVAFGASLMFEAPMIGLEKALFRKS